MWQLHRRNILIGIVGVCAILGFVFLGIVPNTEQLARQQAEIERLKEEIDREKVLLPIFEKLKKESRSFEPCKLPNPITRPLDREEADRLTGLLQTTAMESRMKLLGAVPDINSLTETGDYLSVAIKLTGHFREFRDFLIRLGEVACVHHVERIQIKAIPGTKEFDLTVWFAVGRAGQGKEVQEGKPGKAA